MNEIVISQFANFLRLIWFDRGYSIHFKLNFIQLYYLKSIVSIFGNFLSRIKIKQSEKKRKNHIKIFLTNISEAPV